MIHREAAVAAGEQIEQGMAPGHRPYEYGILLVGVLSVSTASILIRLAGAEAPPLAVGAWRLLLATLFLAPVAWPRLRREAHLLGRREALALMGSGLALALHFSAWLYSLSLTTVASSVILVSTNPIFVGLASHFLLRERVGWRTALAIGLTVAGSVIVSYGDLALSGRALLGNALALLGAVAGSAYILLGRVVRRRLSTWAYVWPCYGLAGLLLLLVCLATRQPLLGYAPQTLATLALLALVPQILGHSAFNWALGRFSPILVTVALLGEPIGATALAFLVLREAPSSLTYIGGPLIMLGILLASLAEARAMSKPML
jgi:drug/metabolite transporter (DMT)-like permease